MHLSLIIPAFNEAGRIEATLKTVLAYFSQQPYDAEVIVVDDGSTDGTADAVRGFPEVRLISYRTNRGKGYAVRKGMLAASGTYRAYYDADASTPIDELEQVWPKLMAGADVVIGSRSIAGAQLEVRQSRYREFMGRVYNLLIRLLGLSGFPDTQCGFKVFTSKAVEEAFSRQTMERFSFDVEILYIARSRGFVIEQIPVRWTNCPHTRVRLVADSAGMFLDVLRIRWRAWRGAYR